MKRRVMALCLLLCLGAALLSAALPAARAADSTAATAQADALKALGLFQGTSAGYELERAPTRIEALVMLIRLLGREALATGSAWKHPFTDVPNWAANYVGYAYQNGLTQGTSATTFGAADTANAKMYLTFVLRALGYSDAAGGDFTYSDPYTLARTAGVLTDGVSTASFTRGDAVLVSWAALAAKLKSSSSTLAARLATAGVFTTEQYNSAKKGLTTTASSDTVLSNSAAKVDVTHTASGYVRIAYTGGSSNRIKAILTGPNGTKYTYNLNNGGNYETFPLSDGEGRYEVGVYVNTSGTRYTTAFTTSLTAKFSNPNAPFLAANQFVNYAAGDAVCRQAATLTKGLSGDLPRVEAVYNYVVDNLTYDKTTAKAINDGSITTYLPDLAAVMANKKGICFDYAALMTAMLRSVGIPTKLVVGYAGSVYHAWISTYTAEKGWVDKVIYFDGKSWKLMDPTFASGASDDSILDYIGNGSNYSAKYYY